ncbi:MAG: VCBS repeat-containing protein [Candidatus Hydrogenedentes bacterium]|nr:VCBS repeat-containing protein [Candidatus Hydrogenedentota bacterium]
MYKMIAAALILSIPVLAEPAVLQFNRVTISEHTYEAASVFDVNNDGTLDLFSGAYWYEGPDFKTSHKVTEIQYVDTYYDDFSNYPMDVNGDGYLDVVTGGWWNQALCWRENPGNTGEWTTHDVAEVGNVERCLFCDLDNDGHLEVLPVTKPIHIFQIILDEKGKGTGAFKQSTIVTDGGGGHGIGCGDINGDGRKDLLFAGGWLEAPEDSLNNLDKWQWHEEFSFALASIPILVHDVNEDGLPDIIVGQGHDYGLYWMEQGKDGEGNRNWTRHDIDMDRSQFHDIQLADIDKDGKLDVVTGKRYHAHNGHDPGAEDPLYLSYYKMNKGAFKRFNIDYGTADKASGAGIYFWMDDVDKNGYLDILAPGKEGLYLFLNQGSN